MNDLNELIAALESEKEKAEKARDHAYHLIAETERELDKLSDLVDVKSKIIQGITLSINTLKDLEVKQDG